MSRMRVRRNLTIEVRIIIGLKTVGNAFRAHVIAGTLNSYSSILVESIRRLLVKAKRALSNKYAEASYRKLSAPIIPKSALRTLAATIWRGSHHGDGALRPAS